MQTAAHKAFSVPGHGLPLSERLRLFRAELRPRYDIRHWWPRRTEGRWEIAVGAVLAQNTAWTNALRALNALLDAGLTGPEALLKCPDAVLTEYIRTAGFFRRKRQTLRLVADFFRKHEADVAESQDSRPWRAALLELDGIGRETADTILLYAFDKPHFIVDAYTRRVGERHLGLNAKHPYDVLQSYIENALPRDSGVYREVHALITELCKKSCRRPRCNCSFLPEALRLPTPISE